MGTYHRLPDRPISYTSIPETVQVARRVEMAEVQSAISVDVAEADALLGRCGLRLPDQANILKLFWKSEILAVSLELTREVIYLWWIATTIEGRGHGAILHNH